MLTSVSKALLPLLCGLAVAAPVASAQDDEVFVAPDSPSGREYELPIESARNRAAGGVKNQSSAAGTQRSPLFGEGVQSGDSSTAGQARTTTQEKSTDAANEAGPQRAQARAAANRKAQAAAPEGGGLGAIVGVGAGVLILGGLAGVLLRRRAGG